MQAVGRCPGTRARPGSFTEAWRRQLLGRHVRAIKLMRLAQPEQEGVHPLSCHRIASQMWVRLCDSKTEGSASRLGC